MPRQLSQLEVIKEFAISLLRQNSLEDLLWDIAQKIGELLGFEDCVIYLIQDDVLVQRAAYGIKNPTQRTISNVIEIKLGDGIVGTVAQTGIAEMVADTSTDPRYISDLVDGRSEVTVPIIAEDQVIGIIDSESPRPNGYTYDDLELMQAIANIASSRIASSMANEERILAQFEQRKYKSQLDNEREWLKTVVNSIQDGIIATDNHGMITVMSEMASRFTGFTNEAAVGKPIDDVFRLDNGFEFSETTTEQQGQLLHLNGSKVKISWKTMPIVYEEIQVGLVIVFRDIEREEFLELEAERAQRIESLGVLAAGIAHDFNNNLQSLVGCLHAIRSGVSDELLPILNIAENACAQSQHLSRQLLTFSKGGTPVLEPIAIDQLLQQSISIAILGRSSRVEFDFGDDLPKILADSSQLEQVFGNLLINAEQSMPDGGVINVRCHESKMPSTSAPAIEVIVSDQGVGIEKEKLDRVFEPYFSTKPDGSGLGLTVTYSIVKRHKGEIFLDSIVGTGTNVRLFFPITPTPVEIPEKSNRDQKLKTSKHILVVDDNPLVLESSSMLLSALGHKVAVAKDEEEAIAEVQAAEQDGQAIEVAILDLMIPGKNGGEVIAQRLSQMTPEIKLIAVSGYSENEVIQNFRDYGFETFLKKPFGKEQLVQAIG